MPSESAAVTTSVLLVNSMEENRRLQVLLGDITESHGHPGIASYYGALGNWPNIFFAVGGCTWLFGGAFDIAGLAVGYWCSCYLVISGANWQPAQRARQDQKWFPKVYNGYGGRMMEQLLLVVWEFVFFSMTISGFLRLKRKEASPIGIVTAACIGMLYWVFYL